MWTAEDSLRDSAHPFYLMAPGTLLPMLTDPVSHFAEPSV